MVIFSKSKDNFLGGNIKHNMYKIEFYDDTTLESLLESFKNLKYCGIEGYVEIDGKKIYGSDSKYKEKLIDIFHSKKC